MTLVGPWTCHHNGCLKHSYPDLERAVGHPCCGRCPQGLSCKSAAWGDAPVFEHPYLEGLVTPGVCSICKHGPH